MSMHAHGDTSHEQAVKSDDEGSSETRAPWEVKLGEDVQSASGFGQVAHPEAVQSAMLDDSSAIWIEDEATTASQGTSDAEDVALTASHEPSYGNTAMPDDGVAALHSHDAMTANSVAVVPSDAVMCSNGVAAMPHDATMPDNGDPATPGDTTMPANGVAGAMPDAAMPGNATIADDVDASPGVKDATLPRNGDAATADGDAAVTDNGGAAAHTDVSTIPLAVCAMPNGSDPGMLDDNNAATPGSDATMSGTTSEISSRNRFCRAQSKSNVYTSGAAVGAEHTTPWRSWLTLTRTDGETLQHPADVSTTEQQPFVLKLQLGRGHSDANPVRTEDNQASLHRTIDLSAINLLMPSEVID